MKFPTSLRVAIVTNLGIFETNSSETRFVQITGGIESTFLNLLAEGLKFQYTALIPADREWGRKGEDGNWTGVIGMVSRNEADIGVGKLGIFHDRLHVVDYSYTYSIEDITFATKAPGFLSKETAVFRPFSVPLWITFSVMLMLVTLVFKFLLKERYRFQDIILYVLGSIVLSAQNLRTSAIREKILVTFWLFSSMFLSYSYMAVLLSFLTIPLKEQPISNKYRLLNVLDKGGYKCLTQKGSSILDTLLSSSEKSTSSIAKYIKKNEWYISTGKDEIGKALSKRKMAVISPRNNFRYTIQENIYLSDDVFFSLYWGIPIKKGFCCRSELDYMIMRLSAAGLYDKSQNDYFFRLQLQKRKTYKVVEKQDTIKSLVLQDLVGAFFFLFAGYILGGFAVILEIFIHKKKRYSKKK